MVSVAELQVLLTGKDNASATIKNVSQALGTLTAAQNTAGNSANVASNGYANFMTAAKGAGLALIGAAAALEVFSRSEQAGTTAVRALSVQTGLTTEQLRHMVVAIAETGDSLVGITSLMELGAKQGLEGAAALEKYARFWTEVGHASGSSALSLASNSIALNAVGLDAENAGQSLAALGFIQTSTTMGIDGFLSIIKRKAPAIKEMGLDINQLATVVGILERSGLSGRAAMMALQNAITNADGSFAKMLELLKITGPEYDKMAASVANSSTKIEELAKAHTSAFTPLQSMKHYLTEFKYLWADDVAAISNWVQALAGIPMVVKGVGAAIDGVQAVWKMLAASKELSTGANVANDIAGLSEFSNAAQIDSAVMDSLTSASEGTAEALGSIGSAATVDAAALQALSSATTTTTTSVAAGAKAAEAAAVSAGQLSLGNMKTVVSAEAASVSSMQLEFANMKQVASAEAAAVAATEQAAATEALATANKSAGMSIGALASGLTLAAVAIAAVGLSANFILEKTTGHGLIEWIFGDPSRADATAAALSEIAMAVRALGSAADPVQLALDGIAKTQVNLTAKLKDAKTEWFAHGKILDHVSGQTADAMNDAKGYVEGYADSLKDAGPEVLALAHAQLALYPELQKAFDQRVDYKKIMDANTDALGNVKLATLDVAGAQAKYNELLAAGMPAADAIGYELDDLAKKFYALGSAASADANTDFKNSILGIATTYEQLLTVMDKNPSMYGIQAFIDKLASLKDSSEKALNAKAIEEDAKKIEAAVKSVIDSFLPTNDSIAEWEKSIKTTFESIIGEEKNFAYIQGQLVASGAPSKVIDTFLAELKAKGPTAIAQFANFMYDQPVKVLEDLNKYVLPAIEKTMKGTVSAIGGTADATAKATTEGIVSPFLYTLSGGIVEAWAAGKSLGDAAKAGMSSVSTPGNSGLWQGPLEPTPETPYGGGATYPPYVPPEPAKVKEAAISAAEGWAKALADAFDNVDATEKFGSFGAKISEAIAETLKDGKNAPALLDAVNSWADSLKSAGFSNWKELGSQMSSMISAGFASGDMSGIDSFLSQIQSKVSAKSNAISAANALGSAITTALKNQYSAQKKTADDGFNAQIIAVNKAYDLQKKQISQSQSAASAAASAASAAAGAAAQAAAAAQQKALAAWSKDQTAQLNAKKTADFKAIDDTYKGRIADIEAFVAAKQDEIKAIRDASSAADEADTIHGLRLNVARATTSVGRSKAQKSLNKELSNVADNSRVEQIQKEIDALKEQEVAIKENYDIQKQAMEERYAAESTALQELIQQKQEALQAESEAASAAAQSSNASTDAMYQHQSEAADAAHEKKLADIEKDKADSDAAYDAKLTDENIFQEALKLMREGKNDEMLALLNEWFPGWEIAGMSLGDVFVNGLMGSLQSGTSQLNEWLGSIGEAVSSLGGSSAINIGAGASAGSGTGNANKTYTVQPGDTLSGIASKLGISDWNTLYQKNSSTIGSNPNLIKVGQALRYATGGMSPGGWGWVGENGPELMTLPRGTNITSNDATVNMIKKAVSESAGASAGDGQPAIINVYIGQEKLDTILVKSLSRQSRNTY